MPKTTYTAARQNEIAPANRETIHRRNLIHILVAEYIDRYMLAAFKEFLDTV